MTPAPAFATTWARGRAALSDNGPTLSKTVKRHCVHDVPGCLHRVYIADRESLAAFHDLILGHCNVPIEVLEEFAFPAP